MEREISDMERAMNRTKARARHRCLPMIKSTFVCFIMLFILFHNAFSDYESQIAA